MEAPLREYFIRSLPDDVKLERPLQWLQDGEFSSYLADHSILEALGHKHFRPLENVVNEDDFTQWQDTICRRLQQVCKHEVNGAREGSRSREYFFLLVAVASYALFVQSNITGPPLQRHGTADSIIPAAVADDPKKLTKARSELIRSLSVDGEAAYKLTPNVEFLCFAKAILKALTITADVPLARWIHARVEFLHQRLLAESAPTLQQSILKAFDELEVALLSEPAELRARLLLERATIRTYYGLDKDARKDLQQAAHLQQFDFTLTGMLGKRTKFQQKDTSQLVVLAHSHVSQQDGDPVQADPTLPKAGNEAKDLQPENLQLNDDTLHESIQFTKTEDKRPGVSSADDLPSSLASLDPGNQPKLEPQDSIILLAYASAITNVSPADGLTREETLPYATRVLDGGSSNWQVYTQALLVRSRIEGYKSRTMERGLLQLQALVDQVIAETSSSDSAATNGQNGGAATSFLPKGDEKDTAPVSQRLEYVFQLASPTRWEMEAELAARWVSVGGVKTALDIYERLEMWAEAALCWAATEREDKARAIVRRQLFHATQDSNVDSEIEKWEGPLREHLPADAPRLFCVLGDLDKDPKMYEEAWRVSNKRYARAKRSLGRHYISVNDYAQAAAAYQDALKVNQLHQASWFALGCALLELSEFSKAAEAFSRAVQLDDQDAEAWSNLAAALLRRGPVRVTTDPTTKPIYEDDEDASAPEIDDAEDSQRYKKDALKAFKRGATLKRDSYRMWDNVLTVAASLQPPSYGDIIQAQKRIIDLRGNTDGEKCVDEDILEMLIRHLILQTNEDGAPAKYDPDKRGPQRFIIEMIEKNVVPLITSSSRLWKLVARLALWRGKPASALEAHEKAWRAVISQPGWEYGTEKQWNVVVEATTELVSAYESLGEMERTEGLAAGQGQLVAKDWKFKARTAIKSVLGRGKGSWEGTDGWDQLKEAQEGLKG